MKTSDRIGSLTLALCLSLPALLDAQASPEQLAAAHAITLETETELRDPSLSSPARLPNLQAILSGTTSSTQAAAEIGIKTRDNLSASLKIAGPIGKQNADTKLATLTTLSDQATATLGIHYIWPSPLKRAFTPDYKQFDKFVCRAWEFDHPGESCPSSSPTATVVTTKLSPAARRLFLQQLGLGHGIGVFAAEATYGAPKTFDFLSSGVFGKEEVRHSAVSVAASLGWMPLRAGFFFGALTYRYDRSFTSATAQDICQPLGVSGASQCQDLPIGPPQKKTSNIAQLEVRKYFANGQVAVNPRLSRDFKQKITGFEVPFYFLKDGKGTLNGGISPGWRSDTKAVTITAFVGSMSSPLGSGSSGGGN